MLLLCVFAGPRARLGEIIGAFNNAAMPCAEDTESEAQPRSARFHQMSEPEPELIPTEIVDDAGEPVRTGDGMKTYEMGPAFDESGVIIHLPPVALTDPETGAPLFEELESVIEVLAVDVDAANEIASRYGYMLRMHWPSGFDNLDQANAVAAGLHHITHIEQLLASPDAVDKLRAALGMN